MSVLIREVTDDELIAVRAIHDAAFRAEGEGLLVARLHADGLVVASVVAEDEASGALLGHALYSALVVVTERGEVAAAALAPVAVLPERQGQGIGTAVVAYGLELCRERGIEVVLVLGDPGYYGRFGFSTELGARVQSPYTGPHFMALELCPGAFETEGEATYPSAFSLVE